MIQNEVIENLKKSETAWRRLFGKDRLLANLVNYSALCSSVKGYRHIALQNLLNLRVNVVKELLRPCILCHKVVRPVPNVVLLPCRTQMKFSFRFKHGSSTPFKPLSAARLN